MRFHLVAGCYVLYFAVSLQFTRTEWAVLAVTIGAMLQAETMNTAVERLCDFVQPQRDEKIRDVKDLAAGAVVLTAIAAAVVGVCMFLRPALWQLVLRIVTTPWQLALFVLSFLAAAAFVVLPWNRKKP